MPLFLIFLYVLIGIFKVILDSKKCLSDQPHYIRNPKLILTLIAIIMWLPLLPAENYLKTGD